MKWSPLNFGKYEGKTLPQVMFSDPDWFFWAYEKRVFKADRLAEATEIYKRACSIRVPQPGEEKKVVVEYIIDKPTGKFGTIRLITQPEGPHSLDISDVIDMSFPRRVAQFDKFGYQTFILVLKKILFGSSGYKMTKKRCEEFFSNNDNFIL